MTRPRWQQFVLIPEKQFEVTYPNDALLEEAVTTLSLKGYREVHGGKVRPLRFRVFLRIRKVVWTEPQKRRLNDSWLKAVESGEILA